MNDELPEIRVEDNGAKGRYVIAGPDGVEAEMTFTKVGAHQLNGLLVCLGAGGQPRGVAGQQVHEQEHQHRDDQERRDQPQQAFDDVVER